MKGDDFTGIGFPYLSLIFGIGFGNIRSTPKVYSALLETQAECIGSHGRKTIPEAVVHCFNCGENPYQCHDSKCNDGNSYSCTQFVGTNSSPGQYQVIQWFHTIKLGKQWVYHQKV